MENSRSYLLYQQLSMPGASFDRQSVVADVSIFTCPQMSKELSRMFGNAPVMFASDPLSHIRIFLTEPVARIKPKRDARLMKVGASRQQASAAWRLFDVMGPAAPRGSGRKGETQESPTVSFAFGWDKLREARSHEGRYPLRSNLPGQSAPQMWRFSCNSDSSKRSSAT